MLRIQLLEKAGFHSLSLKEIQSAMTANVDFVPDAKIKLAQIAQQAGARQLPFALLASALPEVTSQEYLELALRIARELADSDLAAEIAQKLENLFPGSLILRDYKLHMLIRKRDYVGASTLLQADPQKAEKAALYSTLATAFNTTSPDYQSLIDRAGDDDALRETYQVASIIDARQRRLFTQALDLALPLPAHPEKQGQAARFLLETIHDLLLAEPCENQELSERLQKAVASIIKKNAADPMDKELRIGLSRVFQPSVSGTTGQAILLANMLEGISKPVRLRPRPKTSSIPLDEFLNRKSFIKTIFSWLESESPIVVGRTKLPKELLTEPADEVVNAVIQFLDITGDLGNAEDEHILYQWLAFGSVIAPYGTDPDQDITLMRLVAGRLVNFGNLQGARDLAEQILEGATTERRRCLAWLAMADIYNRCDNPIDSLFAMNCALACDLELNEKELYHVFIDVIRILRDNRLHPPALDLIKKARELLTSMDLTDQYEHRLDLLRLQIKHAELLHTNPFLLVDLEALIGEVAANAVMVLERNDSTTPVAAMLGQLLRTARERGVTVSGDAETVFTKLRERTGTNANDLVRIYSQQTPTADDLLKLARASGTTRYSDDVGYDMLRIGLAAKRSLADDSYLQNAEAACLALELLADRGVAVPDWDGAAAPPPAPASVAEPGEIARSISRKGVSLMLIGFDANDRLIRQCAESGTLLPPAREPVELFHKERFDAWAQKFPYEYGTDENTLNLFYVTTDHLTVSHIPEGSVIVVGDSRLQSFPPNLMRDSVTFAGIERPMAAAPSLSWLNAAHAKGLIGDGRYCAWISTAESEGISSTLPMIAERLGPTFAEHDFIVDHGNQLPHAFAGSSMAIVTAHGSLHHEDRFFHLVSDEGVLRVSADDIANALRNIGIVILFVCSGGRSDKHPLANTTIGLARQILDRGCSAVIASPWPLDSCVPAHWLPAFLERWSANDTATHSNWEANRMVSERFSHDPVRGLAMTVFGNPLLCKRRGAYGVGSNQVIRERTKGQVYN